MSLRKYLLFVVLWMVKFVPPAAWAESSVQGQVVDENDKPINGVTWRISAIEELLDGKWGQVMYIGESREYTADSNGSFTVPFNKLQRFDLQFHKVGFAQAFLFRVDANSPKIKVTLKWGERVHGVVSHRVDGNLVPVAMEPVELRLPGRDFWYQERVLTDMFGRYEFRVCTPPSDPSGLKRKWQVVVAGQVVEIDVRDGEPIDEVDFVIDIKVKKHPS